MSFDPFEVRLHFLSLLRKLTASQQSIQTVTSYAAKYARRCGEDLWDCIMEECGKGNLNIRINILYFLDTLCDPLTSLSYLPTSSPHPNQASGSKHIPQMQTIQLLPYTAYLNRDLAKLIALVVPETREGILNLLSAKQILDSWKVRRFVSPETCEALVHSLEERRKNSASAPVASFSSETAAPALTSQGSSSRPTKRGHPSLQSFSRADKLRRMEEDRERHKRLRERMWVLPMKMPPGMGMNTIVGGGGGGVGAVQPVVGFKRDAQGQPLTIPSPAMTASPGNHPSLSPFTPVSPSRLPITPSETISGMSGASSSAVPPPQNRHSKSSLPANRSDGSSTGTHGSMANQLDPIDVEFDLFWENGSDLENEDVEEMKEDRRKRMGIVKVVPMSGDESAWSRESMRIPGLGIPEGVGVGSSGDITERADDADREDYIMG